MHKSIPPQMQVRWWKSQAGGNSRGASGGSRTAGTTLRPNTNLKLNPNFTISSQKKNQKKNQQPTDEGSDDEDDVEGQAGAGADKEGGNRLVRNDGGSDGDGGQQLNGDDGVDFADEGPAELGALEHHRVQRNGSGLHVIFPVRLVPHLCCLRVMITNWRRWWTGIGEWMDSLQENEGNSSPKEVRRTGAVRCFAMRPVYTCEIQAVNSTSDTWMMPKCSRCVSFLRESLGQASFFLKFI